MSEPLFALDDFRIAHRISPGSFGTVYQAHWISRGIDVALKKIERIGEDGEAKQKAEQRGAELQSLFWQQHRALVPEVYAHGWAATGDYCIAMELVQGESLRRLKKPVPIDVAVPIAIGLGNFLARLHRFEVFNINGSSRAVHADLKPEHVYVVSHGICVLDFGISKQLLVQKAATANLWASYPYASPEQLELGEVNRHSDLWAFGVILYETLAGQHPYQRFLSNHSALRHAIVHKEPIAPPPCDGDVAAVVMKMLAPSLQARYQCADDVVADLGRWVAGERPHASDVPTTVVPPAGGSVAETVPTDPVPMKTAPPSPLPLNLDAATRAATPWPRRAATALRANAMRAARVVAVAAMVPILVMEARTWIRAEEFRAGIDKIDIADVPSLSGRLQALRDWAPLGVAVPLRVKGPLTDRLTQLALRPTLQYRTDSPNVVKQDWEDARRSLLLAHELAPANTRVEAQQQYVRGQLARIASQDHGARASAQVDDAEKAFAAAAALDPSSYDPFLGLARIHAYERPDFALLLRDIQNAESRGYQSGRRERAQVGDAFRRRANKTRAVAAKLPPGAERRRQLEGAQSDYQNCVAKFSGLTGYLDSDQNLAQCRSWLERLTNELDSGR